LLPSSASSPVDATDLPLPWRDLGCAHLLIPLVRLVTIGMNSRMSRVEVCVGNFRSTSGWLESADQSERTDRDPLNPAHAPTPHGARLRRTHDHSRSPRWPDHDSRAGHSPSKRRIVGVQRHPSHISRDELLHGQIGTTVPQTQSQDGHLAEPRRACAPRTGPLIRAMASNVLGGTCLANGVLTPAQTELAAMPDIALLHV